VTSKTKYTFFVTVWTAWSYTLRSYYIHLSFCIQPRHWGYKVSNNFIRRNASCTTNTFPFTFQSEAVNKLWSKPF